jgi:hypothetical protein
MLKMCDRWQTENIHSFSPKREVVVELQKTIDSMLARTVWSDSCNSWYKADSQNAPVSLWPGSGLHYMEAISILRAEDYEFQYRGRRFAWLGNGFSQVEADQSCDLAFYVRDKDDSELLGRRMKRQMMAGGKRVDTQLLHVGS